MSRYFELKLFHRSMKHMSRQRVLLVSTGLPFAVRASTPIGFAWCKRVGGSPLVFVRTTNGQVDGASRKLARARGAR
jgi:hypothetical protein